MFLLGETWQPNITMGRTTGLNGEDILYVAFNPGENSDKYNVFVKCSRDHVTKTLYNVRHFIYGYLNICKRTRLTI